MKKKRKYSRGSDLISRLPQPILHHIQSFLLAHDAARMAVLSKTWLQVWNTLPFLDFGGALRTTNFEKMKELFRYANQVLYKRGNNQPLSTIYKFSISGECSKSFASLIHNCAWNLNKLNVRDLCLCNHDVDYIYLPADIFFSFKSIISLHLMGFNLNWLHRVMVTWPSLQKLHLSTVFLSDDLIRNIVASCPGIEDLVFELCSGFKEVTILSLVKLRNFKITLLANYYKGDENPKVDINVPDLESFCYDIVDVRGFMVPAYCNFNTYCNFNIMGCVKLKTLQFYGKGITQDWFDKLFSLFPLLESLTFGNCIMLVKINISSCKLKYLSLRHCSKLVEVNIDSPNLSTFIYSGSGDLLFSLNASPLLEVDLNLTKSIPADLVMCTKIIEFLRMFGVFKFVSFDCSYYKNLAIPWNIKSELNPNPENCGVENLSLYSWGVSGGTTTHEATDILDDLIWIYPRVQSLCILSYHDDELAVSLKRLYDRLRRITSDCCSSLPTKCWRNFVKEVTFSTPEKDQYFGSPDFDEHDIIRIELYPRE